MKAFVVVRDFLIFILDPLGIIFFHFVGWTVILSLIFYDIVDMYR